MQAEIRTGPAVSADGAILPMRGGKSGEASVADAHARYMEAVYRGNVYKVANQAGAASSAGLSATTPVLTLANPAGSGKLGVLIYAGCVFSVAPAAAAVTYLAANINPAAAAVTGTVANPVNALLGTSGAAALKAFTAATLPAAPVAIAQLGVQFAGALTVANELVPMGRWFDGAVILGQGTAISIQTSTASGAAGMFCDYIWEEIPV